MSWQLSLYSGVPLFAAAISLVLVVIVARRPDSTDPLSLSFLVLMVGLFGWSLGNGVQIGFRTVQQKLVWTPVGVLFSSVTPTLWLLLTVLYAGKGEWLTRRRIVLLAIEPAVYTGLQLTWRFHDLVWQRVGLDPTTPVPVLDIVYGPVYYVNLVYQYLLVLAGIGLLVMVLVRSSRVYRKQAALLVVGAVVPLGANVAAVLGASPVPNLDLTTFTFTLTGTAFALALFQFDMLELTPVARERMIQSMGDGLLVVGEDGRIRDGNDVARDALDVDQLIGRSVETIIPDGDLDSFDGSVVEASVDGDELYYDVRVQPLTDYQEQVVGHIVALRDVTDRKAYEERLEVTNRLLRHNLRNDMNVVLSNADVLREELDDEHATMAQQIYETGKEVGSLSQKASRIERTLEQRDEAPVPADVVPVVERLAADARRDWDVTVETDLPESAVASVIARDLLEVCLQNLVENAVEHNDSDDPRIELAVAETDDTITVTVADNGPGIPETEIEPLRAGEETALEHGSGLGLWLVHWIVTESGGDLSFADNEPCGAVVELSLPVSTEAVDRPDWDESVPWRSGDQ